MFFKKNHVSLSAWCLAAQRHLHLALEIQFGMPAQLRECVIKSEEEYSDSDHKYRVVHMRGMGFINNRFLAFTAGVELSKLLDPSGMQAPTIVDPWETSFSICAKGLVKRSPREHDTWTTPTKPLWFGLTVLDSNPRKIYGTYDAFYKYEMYRLPGDSHEFAYAPFVTTEMTRGDTVSLDELEYCYTGHHLGDRQKINRPVRNKKEENEEVKSAA